MSRRKCCCGRSGPYCDLCPPDKQHAEYQVVIAGVAPAVGGCSADPPNGTYILQGHGCTWCYAWIITCSGSSYGFGWSHVCANICLHMPDDGMVRLEIDMSPAAPSDPADPCGSQLTDTEDGSRVCFSAALTDCNMSDEALLADTSLFRCALVMFVASEYDWSAATVTVSAIL